MLVVIIWHISIAILWCKLPLKQRKQAAAEVVPRSRLFEVKLRFIKVKICSCLLHNKFNFWSKVQSTDQKIDKHIKNITRVSLIDQQIKT